MPSVIIQDRERHVLDCTVSYSGKHRGSVDESFMLDTRVDCCNLLVFSFTDLETMATALNIGRPSMTSSGGLTINVTTTVSVWHTSSRACRWLDTVNIVWPEFGNDPFPSPLQCLSVNDLLRSFELDNVMQLTKTQFMELCPALLQQSTQGCRHVEETADNSKSKLTFSEGDWNYSEGGKKWKVEISEIKLEV